MQAVAVGPLQQRTPAGFLTSGVLDENLTLPAPRSVLRLPSVFSKLLGLDLGPTVVGTALVRVR